ncbi:MAG: PEP-CTERM sorting domain-containing protein [Candidatus Sulfotelmatobacter sp.]
MYAYSVVPGGVSDAKELKWVAEHDPVVAEHYAGFDYDRARVVEVTLARTAYVSYRIGNHIYWMRRRISLHKGEKLITDGRITARGRCGNRVAENPQAEVSPSEPSPERMEKPMDGAGTVMPAPPVPFESALLSRPIMPGSEPEGPLNVSTPFGGGNLIAIAPPAFPVGLCAPLPKKGTSGISAIEGGALTNGKKKLGPCGTGGQGPSTVPEPATWMMLMTGFAALLWQFRRKLYRA